MKHQKKKVRYSKALGEIRIGHRAFVIPIDHPSLLVSNQDVVLTSTVVAFNQNGFETKNTIYIFQP